MATDFPIVDRHTRADVCRSMENSELDEREGGNFDDGLRLIGSLFNCKELV